MCCLFGLLDYGHAFHGREKSEILSVLSRECEIRGTDATGIAYVNRNRLRIYKRPLPAHRMNFIIPEDSAAVMGHTRMATQGCERDNYNNHPFEGRCTDGRFALAHNGVLRCDTPLRKKLKLPPTRIQTDSYLAVQLLEKERALTMDSLRKMAETVEGSFSFTVLSNGNDLYFVKGNSPLCIYHFQKERYYLYASTEEILLATLQNLGWNPTDAERILPECGEILKIGRDGKTQTQLFDSLLVGWQYPPLRTSFPGGRMEGNHHAGGNGYLESLRSLAGYYGYSPEDIDCLYDRGYSCGEIEEILYGEEDCWDM